VTALVLLLWFGIGFVGGLLLVKGDLMEDRLEWERRSLTRHSTPEVDWFMIALMTVFGVIGLVFGAGKLISVRWTHRKRRGPRVDVNGWMLKLLGEEGKK
jgi:hypothetical protein